MNRASAWRAARRLRPPRNRFSFESSPPPSSSEEPGLSFETAAPFATCFAASPRSGLTSEILSFACSPRSDTFGATRLAICSIATGRAAMPIRRQPPSWGPKAPVLGSRLRRFLQRTLGHPCKLRHCLPSLVIVGYPARRRTNGPSLLPQQISKVPALLPRRALVLPSAALRPLALAAGEGSGRSLIRPRTLSRVPPALSRPLLRIINSLSAPSDDAISATACT